MTSRSRLLTACGALLALAVAAANMPLALAQAPQQRTPPPEKSAPALPQPARIDRNGVLILIRSTLLALHDANQTGNYTVLRDLGAPGFQAANTAVRLGEIFANLRAQKLDLSGVAVLDPQLTLLPQIDANGMMRMAGFFPSVPLQVNFDLLYAPSEGHWRLFGIAINVGPSSPAAPGPSEAAKPAEATAGQAKPGEPEPTEVKPAPPASPPKPAPRAAPARPSAPRP